MFELRTYTLRSPDAVQQYATVHWPRHVMSLAAFGVETVGVWTQRSGEVHRLVALVRYPSGADPERITHEFMASPEFAADMAGFNVDDIIAVDAVLLDAAPCSPIQ